MATETERRLAEARTQLIDLKNELDVATGAHPDDPNAPEVLELHDEIEAQEKLIKRLERSVEAGKDIAKKNAHEQRAQARDVGMAKAIDLARSRIKVAEEIDTLLRKQLAPLLSKWESIGQECASAAAEAQRYPGINEWSYPALNGARGDDERFGGALTWAIFQTGLGIKGITTFIAQELRRPLGESVSLKEASEITVERLTAQLENLNRIAHEKDILL